MDDIPELELEPCVMVKRRSDRMERMPRATDPESLSFEKNLESKMFVPAPLIAGCPLAECQNRRACKGHSISLILGFMRRRKTTRSTEESSKKWSSTRFGDKSFILK